MDLIDRVLSNKKFKYIYFVIFLMIILLGMLIRIYPYLDVPSTATDFTVNVEYGTFYILNTGHMLTMNSQPLYSSYQNDIFFTVSDPATSYMNSILLIMTGWTNTDAFERFFALFPWQGALLFPLSAILFVRYYSKQKDSNISHFDYLLIFAFASFFSFAVLNWTRRFSLQMGYSLFILMVIFYIFIKPKKVNYLIILTIFFVSIILYYHTDALILFVMLLVVLFIQLLSHKKVVATSSILIYSFLFIGYLTFNSYNFLGAYLGLIRTIPHLLGIGISSEVGSGVSSGISGSISDYLVVQGERWWLYMQYFQSLLIATPLFLAAYFWIKRKDFMLKNQLVIYLGISLVFVAFLLYTWSGIVNLNTRLVRYGGLLTFIVVSIFLAKMHGKMKKLIQLIVVSIITITLISAITYSAAPINSYTYTEKSAETWIIGNVPNENVVFSDYRLAMPLTLYGHMNINGIMDINKVYDPITNLQNIFYGNNTDRAITSLKSLKTTEGAQPSYLLFSMGYTEKTPAIRLHDYVFQPAPKDYLTKYDVSPNFNAIYNCGYCLIYNFI